MTRVVVIGSGFAGLWAALGAARRLDELAVPAGTVDVMVVSNKPFHDIRVRNYEADLSACRIPLGDVLGPAGVAHVTAEVTAIDADGRRVTTSTGASYSYDRLVLASGSHVVKPALPGLAEFGFDVDTYDGAVRLQQHLQGLAGGPLTSAAATVVVVGAGLTGIETACELPGRLHALFARGDGVTPPRGTHRPQPLRRLRYGFIGAAGDRTGAVGQRRRDQNRRERCRRQPGRCNAVIGGNGWQRPPWCGAPACGPAA